MTADRLHVTTTDGKYTVIQCETGEMVFQRHGVDWLAANEDWGHCGLILALAQEIEGLRGILARGKDKL